MELQHFPLPLLLDLLVLPFFTTKHVNCGDRATRMQFLRPIISWMMLKINSYQSHCKPYELLYESLLCKPYTRIHSYMHGVVMV